MLLDWYMQSIIDKTTLKNFQQIPDKSTCHIFHLANVCQSKTLTSSNNKVCSSTLLSNMKLFPMSRLKCKKHKASQVTANF